MQNTKDKLSSSLNLFKFWGIYLENFFLPSRKFTKFLNAWPFVIFWAHVFFTFCLIFQIFYSMSEENYDIHEGYIFSVKICTTVISAVVTLVFISRHQKDLDKLWKLINKTDDLFKIFLGIEIDYKSENRMHFMNTLFHVARNLLVEVALAVLFSYRSFHWTEDFNTFKWSTFYFIKISHLDSCKYIYFITIASTRMKMLVKNYHNLKHDDQNLLALMRCYSYLWKITNLIEKCFNWPMILLIIGFFVSFLLCAHFLVYDLVSERYSFFWVFISVPFINIYVYCYICRKFMEIVSLWSFTYYITPKIAILSISHSFL